jgi:hypothetical protein
MSTSSSSGSSRITVDQIESKLRDITSPVEERVDQARSMVPVIAVAVGAAIVLAAYVLGRRRGKKRTPVIEIRRI